MVYLAFPRRDDDRNSFIRKAMVKTMFRAVQERDPGFYGSSAGFGDAEEEEEEQADGEKDGGRRDGPGSPRTGPGDAIESAAGTCVLWSTVAVGCLIGGRPKSSVSPTRVDDVRQALNRRSVQESANLEVPAKEARQESEWLQAVSLGRQDACTPRRTLLV